MFHHQCVKHGENRFCPQLVKPFRRSGTRVAAAVNRLQAIV
jgi:hypothetical protein